MASEPRAALEPYARLRRIVISLKEAQPRAEGAAPHLMDYTEKLASALRQQLKKFFGDRLEKTLQALKWPTRELNITDSLMAQWRQDVELLIDLQTPYGIPLLSTVHLLMASLQRTATTRRIGDCPGFGAAGSFPAGGNGSSTGA